MVCLRFLWLVLVEMNSMRKRMWKSVCFGGCLSSISSDRPSVAVVLSNDTGTNTSSGVVDGVFADI